MGLRDDSFYLASLKEKRKALSEAADAVERNRVDDFYNNMISAKDLREQRFLKYSNFITSLKEAYLSNALFHICEASMKNPSKYEKNVCKGVISQYIKESEVCSLLSKMGRSRNGILRKLAEDVTDQYKEDIADSSPDDENSYKMDKTKVDSFWKEVDSSDDVADMTNTIRLRVSDAEENFVNKVQQDKANIDTILQDTAERVQNAKETNDNDYASDLEEFYTFDAKRKINDIKHESVSLFSTLVKKISANAIRNHNDLVTENGRIDIDKAIETSRAIYTVLEMLSTSGLEKVDSTYIKETLNSLD